VPSVVHARIYAVEVTPGPLAVSRNLLEARPLNPCYPNRCSSIAGLVLAWGFHDSGRSLRPTGQDPRDLA